MILALSIAAYVLHGLPHGTLRLLLANAALGEALFFANKALSRSWLLNLGAWGVLPVVLTPWWLATNFGDWVFAPLFGWAKLYTIIATCAFTGVARFTFVGRFVRWPVLALFALNVAEAVLVDAMESGPFHVVNAIAGALMFASFVPSASRINIANESSSDLLWPLTWVQILAYTAWNLAFVSLNYANMVTPHIAVLAVPLVACAVGGGPGVWMQARFYTLAAYIGFRFTIGSTAMNAWLYQTNAWPSAVTSTLACVALGLSGWAAVQSVGKARTP